MPERYPFIIIGGGAAGFAGAIRADALGVETLMVHSGLPIGGTCVNLGCVPSKFLLHKAEIVHLLRKLGIADPWEKFEALSSKSLFQATRELVLTLREKKYIQVLERLSRVTLQEGEARFLDPHTIEVDGRRYEGERFLIATGSKALPPSIPGLKEAGFLTHETVFELDRVPESLAVIGAGPVGLEFGQFFRRMGVEVAIFELLPTIFAGGEPVLVERLKEHLEGEGIEFFLGTRVERVEQVPGGKRLSFSREGRVEERVVEEVLIATGKTPNTRSLGLERIGVKTDSRGAILVDPTYRTTLPHIYSAGDCVALPLRLETTAGREGTISAENALLGKGLTLDLGKVPYTLFTSPSLAGVGLTEKQVIERYGRCSCRTIDFSQVPRAILEGESTGTVKIVVEPQTERILGVHILAPHAGELIALATALLSSGSTLEDLRSLLLPFPTYSEALKICAVIFTTELDRLSCCV